MRQLVNALLYLAATRCKWRELPAHFPKRGSVRTYHDRWKQDGTWEKLCEMIKARASDGGQPLMRKIRPADLSTRIAGPIQTTGPLQQATGE
jgi:transposase